MKKVILQAVILAALVSACGSGLKIEPVGESSFGDQTAMVEEIEFRSGQFRLVGDLRYPLEGGPHPVIILVHGSGGATRDGAVNFMPLIELFLRNGYAVFSWTDPGPFLADIQTRAGFLVSKQRRTERVVQVKSHNQPSA